MTTKQTISGFNGSYRFLSNFWPVEIEFEGITYPTVEHAYQAAKTLDENMRVYISNIKSASEAKSTGRSLVLREDWEDVKVSIMRTLLRKKFYDTTIKAQLLATGNAQLEETNCWHDTFWGKCTCERHRREGESWLGNLLMELRDGWLANI